MASGQQVLDCDVLIAGGGPAGLAVAISAAINGLSAIVIERRSSAPDKACGECLMPPAVRALEQLGVRDLVDPAFISPIEGIRFKIAGGAFAQARLPVPGGLGVRRIALTEAMVQRARGLGAEIRERTSALRFVVEPDRVITETNAGPIRSRFLAAADGLSSRLRVSAGLQATTYGPQRFGLRQHFRVPPWTHFVEVHLADGVEAYVTPVGPTRVGVAFLWNNRERVSIDKLLGRFPALAARVAGATVDSRPLGAGPMARLVLARTANRFALVGDAAGYVDAITGEGLSLALISATTLGTILPEVLKRGATRSALIAYERDCERRFRHYSLVTRTMLAFAGRPALHGPVIAILARHPRVLSALLKFGQIESA